MFVMRVFGGQYYEQDGGGGIEIIGSPRYPEGVSPPRYIVGVSHLCSRVIPLELYHPIPLEAGNIGTLWSYAVLTSSVQCSLSK